MSETVVLPVDLPKEVVMIAEKALEEQLLLRADAAWNGKMTPYPSEETHILTARAVYNAIVEYYLENQNA